MFYTDFGGYKKYSFIDGEHFNKRYDKKTKDISFKNMLFDSPVKTGYPENDLVPFKYFTNE